MVVYMLPSISWRHASCRICRNFMLNLYGSNWPCLQSWTMAKCINVIFKNVHDCLYIMRYSCCEGWNVGSIMILTNDYVEKRMNTFLKVISKFDPWGSVLSLARGVSGGTINVQGWLSTYTWYNTRKINHWKNHWKPESNAENSFS